MSTDNKKLVESLIDSMVSGKVSPKDAVSLIVESTDSTEATEQDTVEFKEGEKITCPACGSENMSEGYVESDGDKIPAYVCEDCETGLVESIDDDEIENLVEADIDEDNPICPACGSDDLSAEIMESEDQEEVMVLTCNGCKTDMVVVD